MIEMTTLKDAERVVRVVMVVILLTAGTSKFFSHGGFFDYYSRLFQGDLRIHLPPILVDSYLRVTPFVEVGLACALLSNRHKVPAVYGWFVFMLSLLVGHYILQEWSSVNELLDYFFSRATLPYVAKPSILVAPRCCLMNSCVGCRNCEHRAPGFWPRSGCLKRVEKALPIV